MSEQIIQEIGRFLERNYVLVALLIGTFVQVSPIKVYPVDWIKKGIKWIGSIITTEIITKLNDIEKKVDGLEREVDQNRIKDIRFQILEFDNAITRRKYDYEREAYEHVIYDLHPEYEDLLKKYGKVNGKIDRAMQRINQHYDEHLSDDPTF